MAHLGQHINYIDLCKGALYTQTTKNCLFKTPLTLCLYFVYEVLSLKFEVDEQVLSRGGPAVLHALQGTEF